MLYLCMAKYKIKYQALQRDCFDSKGKKGMSKIITDQSKFINSGNRELSLSGYWLPR